MKLYDRNYFDTWYRQRRIGGAAALARKVALAVAMTEFHLGRSVKSVLDVGCGEGAWRSPLRRLRPDAAYLGLDSSEYAIARYGRARNLRPGRFGDLQHLRFERSFDLVVCADVLHYLDDGEIRRGLEGITAVCGGLAFIEVYTREDEIEGDMQGFRRRPARWYRDAFARAGLTACGMHGYLVPDLAADAAALERLDAGMIGTASRRGGRRV